MSVALRSANREKLYIDVGFTKSPLSADQQDGSGDLELKGWASTWAEDRDAEVVSPKAFDASLPAYMAKNPVLLYQHSMDQPIGTVAQASTDSTGLFITAHVPNPGSDGADYQKGAYFAIKSGFVKTFSIGGFMSREVTSGKNGPQMTITDVELFEISAVSIPANPDSVFVAAVKSIQGLPPTMSDKATSQLEQLLGFKATTDPELLAMKNGDREYRYRMLAEMFRRANGQEPPPLDAYRQILAARDGGVSPVKIAQATTLIARSFYLPETARKARTLTPARQTALEGALDAHGKLEESMVTAANAMKDAAGHHAAAMGAIKDVLGIAPDGTDDGTQDADEQADEEPTSPKKTAKDPEDGDDGDNEPCVMCKGTGKIRDGAVKCPRCGGSGIEPGSPATDAGSSAVDGDDVEHKEVDEPDAKGALSAPNVPFAARNTSWDASAAISALKAWAGAEDAPNAKLRRAYLWQDGDGTSFGDLKYPICSVFDGELKCVFAAVSAAAGRAKQQNLTAIYPALRTLYAKAARQFGDSSIVFPGD